LQLLSNANSVSIPEAISVVGTSVGLFVGDLEGAFEGLCGGGTICGSNNLGVGDFVGLVLSS